MPSAATVKTTGAAAAPAGDVPDFHTALRYWLLLGFISFGGPTGQIAIMHRDLVERRHWITEARFLHALNYCVLLPGPEAQQLAIYVGWLLHGVPGGAVAGVLFVLPSAVLLLGLSWAYVAWGDVPLVAGLFTGLRPAVVAVVAVAIVRIGRRALRTPLALALAAAAFVARLVDIAFPLIVASAIVLGLLVGRVRPRLLAAVGHGPAGGADSEAPPRDAAVGRSTRTAVVVCLLLWLAPFVLLPAWPEAPPILRDEAVFFSTTALVTFGGAYAVLDYIRDAAVAAGWLAPGQMMDGLGLAETTPGPLIMVTQFVGFVAAWRHPGALTPPLAAVAGALVTTWVTFVPCFLWIFAGAPYIERLRARPWLDAALGALTAVIVGVLTNLALAFAAGAFFPAGASLDAGAVAVTLLAVVALQRWGWPMPAVILASAALGALRHLAAGLH